MVGNKKEEGERGLELTIRDVGQHDYLQGGCSTAYIGLWGCFSNGRLHISAATSSNVAEGHLNRKAAFVSLPSFS